jgi:hypothetical protein
MTSKFISSGIIPINQIFSFRTDNVTSGLTPLGFTEGGVDIVYKYKAFLSNDYKYRTNTGFISRGSDITSLLKLGAYTPTVSTTTPTITTNSVSFTINGLFESGTVTFNNVRFTFGNNPSTFTITGLSPGTSFPVNVTVVNGVSPSATASINFTVKTLNPYIDTVSDTYAKIYYFIIDSVQGPNFDGVQMSELKFYSRARDSSSKIDMRNVSITQLSGTPPAGQGLTNLFDDINTTKWYSGSNSENSTNILTITFPSDQDVQSYSFNTAGDFPNRTPSTWRLLSGKSFLARSVLLSQVSVNEQSYLQPFSNINIIELYDGGLFWKSYNNNNTYIANGSSTSRTTDNGNGEYITSSNRNSGRARFALSIAANSTLLKTTESIFHTIQDLNYGNNITDSNNLFGFPKDPNSIDYIALIIDGYFVPDQDGVFTFLFFNSNQLAWDDIMSFWFNVQFPDINNTSLSIEYRTFQKEGQNACTFTTGFLQKNQIYPMKFTWGQGNGLIILAWTHYGPDGVRRTAGGSSFASNRSVNING